MCRPDINDIVKRFNSAQSRCIFLDYDGTLVGFTAVPETTGLTDEISDVLQKLANKSDTHVFIITGRSYDDAVKIFDHVSATVIAEHGSVIRENFNWLPQVTGRNFWRVPVFNALSHATERCPGSFIEEKSFTIAWHYRNASPQTADLVSSELVGILSELAVMNNLRIIEGKKVVEVIDNKVGKGLSVKRIYENTKSDFILAVGDDLTDEEMFRYLSTVVGAVTVKVGEGDTCARYKLNGTDEVLNILKKLAL
jgi:trehalose 6-phosphate synthase/phosphatase